MYRFTFNHISLLIKYVRRSTNIKNQFGVVEGTVVYLIAMLKKHSHILEDDVFINHNHSQKNRLKK